MRAMTVCRTRVRSETSNRLSPAASRAAERSEPNDIGRHLSTLRHAPHAPGATMLCRPRSGPKRSKCPRRARTGSAAAQLREHAVDLVGLDEHLAGLGPLRRADDPAALHE